MASSPQTWDRLTQLVQFNTWGGVTGTIYTTLVQLSRLQSLDLSVTYLNGTIPTYLGRLSVLTRLHLYQNELLTGTIPTVLGHLSQLSGLDLSELSLTRAFPTEIRQWKASRGGKLARILIDCDVVNCSC